MAQRPAHRRRRIDRTPQEMPREILDRVARVQAYHQGSKLNFPSPWPALDEAHRTSPYRVFPDHPKTSLPANLRDAPLQTLSLLESSLELPENFVIPPTDMRTLATWLFMASGRTRQAGANNWIRSYPSEGGAFPCEIYVAALAIEGLADGLYHFSPREFALRKLRDGDKTLTQLTRGRPDLGFIKTAPAVLLVSTIFCRSSSVFQKRGYRHALLDTGHLVQNLVTTAAGMGLRTTTRLRVTDSTSRELIGVFADADYGAAEAVQAMVVWNGADQTVAKGMAAGRRFAMGQSENHDGGASAPALLDDGGPRARFVPNTPVASLNTPDLLLPSVIAGGLAPIPRYMLAPEVLSYGSILTVHEDCIAPGVAVREIRSPLTETRVFAEAFTSMPFPPPDTDDRGGPLRTVLLGGGICDDFTRQVIPRGPFLRLNRLAFRGGTFFPLFPLGSHVALVRPFWLINGIAGMDDGVWHYDPTCDQWALLRAASCRIEAKYLSREQESFGNASAVCFMCANLQALMAKAGPDIYRLAHLEAGAVAQRFHLATQAMELGCRISGSFYDDEVRKFLDIASGGWEPVHSLAIGVPAGK